MIFIRLFAQIFKDITTSAEFIMILVITAVITIPLFTIHCLFGDIGLMILMLIFIVVFIGSALYELYRYLRETWRKVKR